MFNEILELVMRHPEIRIEFSYTSFAPGDVPYVYCIKVSNSAFTREFLFDPTRVEDGNVDFIKSAVINAIKTLEKLEDEL